MIVDATVIAGCQAGDPAAFRLLYDQALPRVRTWVARLLGPVPQVADLVQDVFVQVYRSIGAFRGDAAFGSWLYRLTLNVVTSHLRRRRPEPSVEDEQLEALPAAYDEEQRLLAREDLRRLYGSLDALSPDNRVAFVLFELEGLPLHEIAEVTGAGIPTVAARLRRARLAVVAAFDDAPAEAEQKTRRRR